MYEECFEVMNWSGMMGFGWIVIMFGSLTLIGIVLLVVLLSNKKR